VPGRLFSAPYRWASCDPLASRQTSTMQAMTQAAAMPMNGWLGQPRSAATPTGIDQIRAQATVRQGTCQRASGPMWATAATTNGSRSRRKNQEPWVRPTTAPTTPHRATASEASTVRRPLITA
jgi:hypothetical protein